MSLYFYGGKKQYEIKIKLFIVPPMVLRTNWQWFVTLDISFGSFITELQLRNSNNKANWNVYKFLVFDRLYQNGYSASERVKIKYNLFLEFCFEPVEQDFLYDGILNHNYREWWTKTIWRNSKSFFSLGSFF